MKSFTAIHCLLLVALFTTTLSRAQASCAPMAYQDVAAEWLIPADVFYAISLTESGRYTKEFGYNVWPWALNIDEQSHYPETKEAALVLINRAIERGTDKIAIGLMQVYWRFHQQTFQKRPEYALDIGSNLRAGAKILREFMDKTGDVWTAVGYYYAGSSQSEKSRQAAAWYRQRVLDVYTSKVLRRCDAL